MRVHRIAAGGPREPPCRRVPVVLPQELRGRAREVEPLGGVQEHGGVGEARDHHAVPRRDHLVVPVWRCTLEPALPQRGTEGLVQDPRDTPPLTPRGGDRFGADAPTAGKALVDAAEGVVRTLALRVRFVRGRVTVRVEGRRERTLGGHHLPVKPVHERGGGVTVPRRTVRVRPLTLQDHHGAGEHPQQLGVVVEHLLVVRQGPVRRHGVAEEPASHVVLEGSEHDCVQRPAQQLACRAPLLRDEPRGRRALVGLEG